MYSVKLEQVYIDWCRIEVYFLILLQKFKGHRLCHEPDLPTQDKSNANYSCWFGERKDVNHDLLQICLHPPAVEQLRGNGSLSFVSLPA